MRERGLLGKLKCDKIIKNLINDVITWEKISRRIFGFMFHIPHVSKLIPYSDNHRTFLILDAIFFALF